MHHTQHAAAARALEAPLARLYPCMLALRSFGTEGPSDEGVSYKEGFRLAARELAAYYDSDSVRVLRFLSRDNPMKSPDLPEALQLLQRALEDAEFQDQRSRSQITEAWEVFRGSLSRLGIDIDEPQIGAPFDALKHHAVAGSPGTDNETIVDALSPSIAFQGEIVVWAKVRTG